MLTGLSRTPGPRKRAPYRRYLSDRCPAVFMGAVAVVTSYRGRPTIVMIATDDILHNNNNAYMAARGARGVNPTSGAGRCRGAGV